MTYWDKFVRSLRVELHRAVLSKRFAVCVLCEVFILILIAGRHMNIEGVGVTYIFEWFQYEPFHMIFLVLPAVPFAHSYMSDQDSRFLIQAQARVGKRAYAASKAYAAILSGALSIVVSRLILLVGLSCLIPLCSSWTVVQGYYGEWVLEGHIVLFFLSQFLVPALTGGLVAALALWVSTWMKNLFVIVAAPLIGYYAQDMISYFLGLNAFRYLSLSSIIFFTPGFSSLAVCLIYSCFALLLLTGLFMYLFWAKAVREV